MKHVELCRTHYSARTRCGRDPHLLRKAFEPKINKTADAAGRWLVLLRVNAALVRIRRKKAGEPASEGFSHLICQSDNRPRAFARLQLSARTNAKMPLARLSNAGPGWQPARRTACAPRQGCVGCPLQSDRPSRRRTPSWSNCSGNRSPSRLPEPSWLRGCRPVGWAALPPAGHCCRCRCKCQRRSSCSAPPGRPCTCTIISVNLSTHGAI